MTAALAVATFGLVGVACTTPTSTATPTGFRLAATRVVDVDQNEYTSLLGSLVGPLTCPQYILTNVVGVNCYDEPYTVQVGFTVAIARPNSAQVWVVDDYKPVVNGNFFGQGVACSMTDGRQRTFVGTPQIGPIPPIGFYVNGPSGPTGCNVPAAMGAVDFTGSRAVAPVDILDIVAGAPLKLAGTIQLTFEADSLVPAGGPIIMANGVAALFKDALNQFVASGQIPSADALPAFIQSQVTNLATVIAGFVLDGVTGLGNGDDLLSITPQIFVGVKGTLANLTRAVFGFLNLEGKINGNLAGIGLRIKTGVLEPQTFTVQHDAQTTLLNLTGALGLDSPTTRWVTDHAITRA